MHVSHQNSYAGALTPSMTVFGDGVLERESGLDEVIRVRRKAGLLEATPESNLSL